MCSRDTHSSDNYINNQHIKPKVIHDKKTQVILRKETGTGMEKLEGSLIKGKFVRTWWFWGPDPR